MKAGWQMKTLGDVCDKASSNISQNQLHNEIGEYPIFGASGLIKNVSFYHHDKPYLSIVKDGSGVGRVTKMDAFTSVIGTLQYILPNDEIDLDYLNYSLMSVDFKKYVAGAAIPHIYFKDYKNEPFLWMPLPEQKRLVAILDQAFEGIAKARANAEQNLQHARALFESHLQSVFSQRSDEWEEKTLHQIAENLDSKRVPITKNVRINGAYPYYGASGVVDYVSEFIFDDDLLLVSEDGANLLARTYPIAFSIRGKTWVNNHAHVLRFKEMATQKLVEFYLNSIPLNDFVSGMAQPKLNQKMLNTIPIPFPPLTQQQAIVAKLDELSSETQHLEALCQRKIALLDELKKSLLQQAFAGEL